MKNNLFYYATSELSQDAFVCWLSSFALEESKQDFALKECAKKLLSLFVPELSNESFRLTDIERQVKHIDVLLTIETKTKTYKVIVEDKTFTSEHDEQLTKYLTVAKEQYPGSEVRGVYFKTGFQSDVSGVIQAGYKVITREQILQLLQMYIGKTTNHIFIDYYEFWNAFQEETELYRTREIEKWDWKQINGFYDFLKKTEYFAKRNFWMGYDYVSNRNGGFYGFWAGLNNSKIIVNNIAFDVYLQLELNPIGQKTSLRLCLRIGTESKDKDAIRAVVNELAYEDDGAYKLGRYNFVKPSRIRAEQTATIGLYDASPNDFDTFMETLDLAIKDYLSIIDTLRKK